jgi:multisubunit Na+/H+ antiporter MnhG subunit
MIIILGILACFCEELRNCADCLHTIASIVFYCTIGCMASQVLNEVKFRKENPSDFEGVIVSQPAQPYDSYIPPKGSTSVNTEKTI